MLSGVRIMTRGEGDCNVVKSSNGSVQADFQAWKVKFMKRLQDLSHGEEKSCGGNCKTGSSWENKGRDGQEDKESTALQSKEVMQNSRKDVQVRSECRSGLGWARSRDSQASGRVFNVPSSTSPL